MKALARLFSILIVLAAACIVAYTLGKRKGEADSETALIQNVAFVRDIAELSSVEVGGTTTYKSTNAPADATGISASLRKAFLEKTVTISAPYVAKYGVDLSAQNFRIVRADSGVEVHLPHAQLLSFELRLDRLETAASKGLLLFENDDFYTAFEKRMYAQSRAQMETSAIYLRRAEDRVCGLMRRYFGTVGLPVRCVFAAGHVQGPKG
jgi:hypothetical protein